MSLTTCIQKAGKALNQHDKREIINRASALRAKGIDNQLAAIQAVDEQIKMLEAKLAPTPDSAAAEARADVMDALADLGDILSKGTRANITPEQEQKLLPVLTRLFDAAFRLGFTKFKQASKWVLDTIREKLGPDVADALTIDHLQGAYITMSARYRDQGADSKRDVISVENKAEIDAYKETDDAPDRNPNLEPDRPAGGTPDVEAPVRPGGGSPGGRASGNRSGSAGQGNRPDGPPVVPGTGPAAPGAQGDSGVRDQQPTVGDGAAGGVDDQRGDPVGDDGLPIESLTDAGTEKATRRSSATTSDRLKAQKQAESLPVDPKSEESIRASLPILLPQQQDDVIFALKRFEVEDGYGVLFTNGTGTGKTFSGLGIAKIYAKQGKGNILVVAPNQEVIDAWVGAGPMVGLNVTQLKNTKDMGTGVVVTTFANLKDNNALVRRPWDMMIVDEAQNLSANAEGDVTDALEMVNALMLHPAGVPRRTRALHPELYDKIMEGNDRYKKAEKQKDRVLMNAIMREMEPFQREWSRYFQQTRDVIDAAQGKTRPRAVMLSATPFAYEKSVKFAQGYLFDWNKGYVDSQAYNAGSPYQQFMMRHFGYRMRTGKLTLPDPKKVDTGLMQRRFNSWLREEGSLSGRMLDVDADYDRRFVAAHSEVGTRIDQAFQWFWDTKPADLPGLPFDENGIGGSYEQQVGSAMHVVRGALMARFDYRSRMRLLEALKAEAAIPYIRESLRLGRKVVVFHDLIKGQVLDPFNVSFDPLQESEKTKIAVWEKWKTLFPDLADFDFKSLKTPIQTLKEAFGEDAFELNGPNGKKANAASIKALNDDARGPMVLIVQSDKEAGWSGHDTTGRYPRVIVNLGLPVRPTRSIQQEGRIYRVGQVSDAMFRYFNTQTAWEQAAFANTMARRASTAENLAMGEQARGLLDAYIEAFVDTDEWTPGFEGEGTGGKQRDRDMAKVISEFDLAKTLYWAGQKKTQRDKGQEGKDYFATPEPLGLKMVQWLDLRPGESAIEPSGGHGAIARWLPDTVERLAVEPSPKLNARLALAFNGKVRQHTFEELDQINKADGMAMNPPFGVGGKLAIEHLDKAYNQHLQVGGRIAVLIPEGPSADARFDKWFGGSHEKPTTVLGTIQVDRSDKRELRRGDTIYTKLSFARSGKLRRASDHGGYWIKVEGQTGEIHITPEQIIDVTSDGPLKETVQSAPGAHIVATIRLPRATFGRAGTEVASRIVIIDKLAKDQVAPSEEISWDFSGLDSAEALFDTIENLVVPERTKPRPVDAEDEGIPAEGPEKEKEKPKPVDPLKTDAKDGEQAAADAGLKIIDYTTAKGKNLRVYVAEHLTREQADEIEGMAWKPKGAAGWYIKTKNIPAMLGKYPPPSAPLLSEGPGSEVDFNQAKAAVAHVMKGWATGENMPKVEVVQTAFDLPPDIFGWLNSMRANNTARGLMMPDGRVFLMADKFDDIEGVQRTLFHEVYGHFGMRVFLGDKYASTMALLRMANPKLAAEANDWFASLGQKQINARVKNGMDRESAEKIVRILAVEEALADRAGENAPPSGWKMVMARIQKWLRDRGMASVANWLESKTEAETFALLMNARKVVKAPHINQREDAAAPVLSTTTARGRIRLSLDQLVEAADSQASWKDWYDRHKPTVDRLFGQDADLFQKILSATSQRQSVKGNVTIALRAYEQMVTGQPFTGYLAGVVNNLERIRAGVSLNGPKISEFEKANLGDVDAMAVDRHIAQLMFNTSSPNARQVEAAKRRMRQVADRLGWTYREAQAALWAFNQVRLGVDPTKVVSYEQVLESRADLIESIHARLNAGGRGGLQAGRATAQGSQEAGAQAPALSEGPRVLGDVAQSIDSAATSRKQVPAAMRKIAWEPGTINVDIGAGKFSDATDYLAEEGVRNIEFDPFNRTEADNFDSISALTTRLAETATVLNVLNVIPEAASRDNVIRRAAKAISPAGTAYFQVYEGDGSGVATATRDGWQENRKADTYLEEIRAHFGSVVRHGQVIEATDPVKPEFDDWAAPGGGIMFDEAAAAAPETSTPAAPALKPSTGLLDAAARLSVGHVSKITGPAYDGLIDVLDRSMSYVGGDYYEYAKAGLVDQYGLDPNHSEAKTAMKTAIRVNARKTKEVVDKLQALTRAESRVAYLWMSDKAEDTASERALFDQLPESSRDLLTSLKADIEHLGDEAVELGLISHDVRQRNAMAYLHRSYEKYENQDPLARTTRARAVSILGEQFKGRGMRDDAGMEKIGTSEWWQRKTNGSAHDPSLKGKKFHRLELRKLPDDATPQMFEDENGKKLGRLQKVMYWPVDEAIPPQYADWRVDGTWEARWFNKAGKVGMFRDFTLAERTKMGEIQEVKYAVATTMLQMVRDVETARFLDWVARNEAKLDESQLPAGAKVVDASERLTRSFIKNEWVQVPDGLIPGTGVKRFGNLGGRFVPGPVWNDIRQISSLTDQGDLSRAYQSILRAWKVSKTALSPVTHMNNVMSNFMMADAHDIQARHIYEALKAWTTQKSDPEAKRLIEDYQDNGGDAGMFNEAEVRAELFQPLLDELRSEIERESGTAMMTAAQVMDLFQHRQFRQAFAAIGQTRAASAVTWAPKKLIKLYGVEDEVFRLAAFVKARADGVSDHDAGKFARDSFLNYEITAPWINAARRSAWPFAAFSYRAIPMMLNVATHKPHKVAKYMALGAALNWMAYAMLGADGDEDRERAFMADEKAGKIWGFLTPKLVRMPWNDKNKNPVFLDIRRWIPGGDIVDMGQSQSAVPIPPPLIPGGPAVLAAEVLLNSSLFTGQDITQRTDTLAEKFGKSADFMWKGVAPNFPGVPGTWATAALADAARGKVNPGPFGEEASSMGQALISGIGIKVRSYPTGSLVFNAQAKAASEEAEIKTQLKKDYKLMQRNGMSQAEFMDRANRAQNKVIDIRRDLQEKAKRAGLGQ